MKFAQWGLALVLGFSVLSLPTLNVAHAEDAPVCMNPWFVALCAPFAVSATTIGLTTNPQAERDIYLQAVKDDAAVYEINGTQISAVLRDAIQKDRDQMPETALMNDREIIGQLLLNSTN